MMPKLQAPIVLVHGLFGFGRLQVGPWALLDYFRGVPAALAQADNRVHLARLSKTASIADRAAQLRDFVRLASPDEPVHVVAHSMGGLDARYMISRLGMAGHVRTLTTLGTPHRGSPFADWAKTRLVPLAGPVFDYLMLPRGAFDDLTVDRCRRFNEATPDADGVRYFSVAGRYQAGWRTAAWRVTAPVVERAEGPSDGVVSVQSATWGESLDVWEGADHLHLINWPSPGYGAGADDRLSLYARLFERLRDSEGD